MRYYEKASNGLIKQNTNNYGNASGSASLMTRSVEYQHDQAAASTSVSNALFKDVVKSRSYSSYAGDENQNEVTFPPASSK